MYIVLTDFSHAIKAKSLIKCLVYNLIKFLLINICQKMSTSVLTLNNEYWAPPTDKFCFLTQKIIDQTLT